MPVYIHSNSTLLTLAGMLNSILHIMYARKCERMKRNGCVISILGDPGAVSRVDKMPVVKVYCKIETSPWELTLTEAVPEAFELLASDWPENFFLAN